MSDGPNNEPFIPLGQIAAKPYVHPPREHLRTRFDLRELVEVKGITFVVEDVGENRLVLKPIDPRSWK